MILMVLLNLLHIHNNIQHYNLTMIKLGLLLRQGNTFQVDKEHIHLTQKDLYHLRMFQLDTLLYCQFQLYLLFNNILVGNLQEQKVLLNFKPFL